MMKKLVVLIVLVLLVTACGAQSTPEAQREYLKALLKILPDTPSFNQWLQSSGELPPDFFKLPRQNGLPDPLRFLDGRPVRNELEWRTRRAEIKQLLERYALGRAPARPKIDHVVQLDEKIGEGMRVRHLRLEFGPASRGKLRVELYLPEGKGPFPVLLGPAWIRTIAQQAVRRGYLCMMYAGGDGEDDAEALSALYPDYDFALLYRRAWAGSLALDYLATLPEADMKHVAATGHSRDGKQILILAAFDERIAAVMPTSTGVGGFTPYRMSGERGMSEGLETTTRRFPTWFHPRLRFFTGQEDRLPVDGNLLLALLAPRACLMSHGINDAVTNVWGDEHAYRSALPVYRMLGHPERIGIQNRVGFHEFAMRYMEEALDWLDIQFGRSDRTWKTELVYDYTFADWLTRSGEKPDLHAFKDNSPDSLMSPGGGAPIRTTAAWEQRAAEVRKQVRWMLGERPAAIPEPETAVRARLLPAVTQPAPFTLQAVAQHAGEHAGWRKAEADQTAARYGLRFGNSVSGDLYYPASAAPESKLPVVIWLHGYGHALGYAWEYRWDLHPILALVKAGYAVFAFDMIGFGQRSGEVTHFHDRYPHWSEMGSMVDDTSAAIGMLQKNPMIDPDRVYLFGYSIGGTVGLYTAALDPRVKGVVSISGFTPMRQDTAERGAGGLARYCDDNGFLPRLCFFRGQETRLPYDFHDLIGTVAPRPVLVMAPQLDRDANPADVHAAVDQARQVFSLYGAGDKLSLFDPWDYNRLPEASQDKIIEWMKANMK